MPLSFSMWFAKHAGNLVFFCGARRRKIALHNVHMAFGNTLSETNKRNIARASFQNIAISLIELFLIKKIKTSIDDRITIFGNEHLEQAFAQRKGVVLVISHLGSWEYLSFLPRITGQKWTVVIKNARNPYLAEYIKQLRLLTAVRPVDKDNAVRPMLTELKNNRGVGILIDQWAGDEGLWVDFFNTKTSTTSIPAKLAIKTGCALIPGYCLRTSLGKYEIHIHPAVLLDQEDENREKRTTEKLNKLLEEQIRKNPEQWFWGHRRWKEKPSHRGRGTVLPHKGQ